jgi:enediyne biosynthesis protein E2
MPSLLGALRRRLFAPSLASVGFAGRGFPVTATAATSRLEMVPQSVVCGFEWGIEDPPLWEAERRLDMVEPVFRGFAYEGATMAYTLLDVMPGRRRDRTRQLLLGPGRQHVFLAYIGIGFAMARLPRPLWKKVLPDLTGVPYHPTMSWLAVDGYGFDRAYFDTRKWVDEQFVPEPYPWAGVPEYFQRAVDQGIGRALWFIHGAVASAVAEAVNRFPEPRRADLWSGVGLAATFAGGCDRAGLAELRESAGAYHDELALGVVFAIKARTYASFVPRHSRMAALVLADLSAERAVLIADSTVVEEDHGGPEPAYELWRQRIRGHFGPADKRLAS